MSALLRTMALVPMLLPCLVCPLAGQSAGAPGGVTVQVVLTGIRTDSGTIRSVLCKDGERFPNSCAIRAETRAGKGAVVVAFPNVAPGKYAFAAFHDANDDRRVGVNGMGFPTEGLAYSNDAMGTAGPPTWAASAFTVAKATRVTARMRYW